MPKNKTNLSVGTVHRSNKWGDFEIIEYISSVEIKIRFLDTNSVTFCRASHIKDGCIKDVYAPSVCGVGYLGEGVSLRKDTGKWTCYIDKEGVRYRLGCYETKEEAISVRRDKEIELYGKIKEN